MAELTYAEISKLLKYDPETGKFTWLTRTPDMFPDGVRYDRYHACSRWNTRYAGKPAFATDNHHGYFIGGISNKNYMAHRIAWLLTHGGWPSGDIDHINGNRFDNRLSNLRCVSRSINLRNAKRNPRNKSGAVGVCYDKARDKWSAELQADGVRIRLGRFDSFDEAVKARTAALKMNGFTDRHGSVSV